MNILPSLQHNNIKLEGILPISDFIPRDADRHFNGVELVHESTAYTPAEVVFCEQGTPSAYCLKAKDAVQSQALLNALSLEDRQRVIDIAAMELPKPDYSAWAYRSECCECR